ncbi:MAG: hypothetical protein GWM92_19875 [Gemmatimonadetes bacterium]|nr:serine hydrolase [Gemmatimonadota bacterium]NIR81078.1 serine hydrolase [Gemmatimonadota bacterium]NIT89896.1 serine hydrolase [Gemmatimonadota bacterium]NIU33695.1 serine hydrolase [Gemmatimonadota bacterium]NIU37938.1 hypothetical protein [Gemmatimonadota bacterium]
MRPRHRTTRAVAPLLLLGALPTAAAAQPADNPRLQVLQEKFRTRLARLAREFEGVAGIQATDLVTGERFGVHEDLVFPQGSAIKIPVLLELFRRADDDPRLLARRRRITAADQVGGSGVLKDLTDGGTELTLEDLAVLMITESDNTATNLLIDEVGMGPVNRLMDGLGASSTRLRRKMIRPEASARGDENVSTPAEAAGLMARIHRCDLPMAEEGCRRARGILEIPKGGPVRRPIPAEVPVAFKPGGIEGVSTVWALVGLPDRPYVLTVMTTYGGPGGELVERASEAAWEYFRRLSRSTGYGTRVPLEVIRGGTRPPP